MNRNSKRNTLPARHALAVALAAALGSGASLARADGLPTGGTVTVGSATIGGSGSSMVINQSGSRLAIDWQSFSIGAGNSVSFVQPGAGSIALNRVVGNEASVINGSLTANGQVFIVNSAGVIFGAGSSVNTGGLVASTLDLSAAAFAAGSTTFGGAAVGGAGTGGTAAGGTAAGATGGTAATNGTTTVGVSNAGSITATNGGYVALVGATVKNTGSISADGGMVALAAGRTVTLNFDGNALLGLTVDAGVLDALVSNGGAIRADAGRVLLTANAADALIAGQVSNTGVIEAHSLDDLRGSIRLEAPGGSTSVGGSLLATSAGGGAGGSILTSGRSITVADDAIVSTASAGGATGQWTLGADAITVGSGGAIKGATLGRLLASNNIDLAAGAGDLVLNDATSWSASTALGLAASGTVAFNAPVTAGGDAASVAINGAGGYAIDLDKGGAVTLGGAHAALSIDGTGYTLIHNLDELAATVDPATLAATGNYAIANDIDASGRSWNGSVLDGTLVGTLAGMGHGIKGLNIATPAEASVGLIGSIGYSNFDSPLSAVRDLSIINGNLVASVGSGGLLAGMNNGLVSNARASGSVGGRGGGGLVGSNFGTIADSSAEVNVAGTGGVGGLVGWQSFDGVITGSHASGTVTLASEGGGMGAGGLLGMGGGSITDSYATGRVVATNLGSTTAVSGIGGLAGSYYGSISGSWASSTVDVTNGQQVGGLVGDLSDFFFSGTIQSSRASGNVNVTWTLGSIGESAGGLVGRNSGGQILDSRATGNVTVTAANGSFQYVGGLAGENASGLFALPVIDGAQASGNVTAPGIGYVGGLVGINRAESVIRNSGASGNVIGFGGVGGLVGFNGGTLSNVTASGNVTGAGDGVGGIAGQNVGGIDGAHSTGNVSGRDGVGGLVGENIVQTGNDGALGHGSISNSTATGDVSGRSGVGGLAGYNDGAISGSTATGSVADASDAPGRLVGTDHGTVSDSSYTDVVGNEIARRAPAVEAAGVGARELRDFADNSRREAPGSIDPQGAPLRIPRLDANLRFRNTRGYTPSITRIEIDGQVFEIDDGPAAPAR